MEPITLTEAARTVLIYIAPLIAAGALAKIGEDATDEATRMLERVWDALGRRMRGHAESEAVLTLFAAKPTDPLRQQVIEAEVIERFQADPVATQELIALARAVAALAPSSGPQRQHTQIIKDKARVGIAVAGDVHGNLTLGSLDPLSPKADPVAAGTPPRRQDAGKTPG